jgi:cytochrome bd-type quinol oxidase subunit 1
MTPPEETRPSKLDLKKEIEHSEWKKDPIIGFDQRASYTIAQWILVIFGGVYLLGFIAAFILFTWKDATFEKGSDLVKFMVQLPLPLVTLAVGYYLGDRNRQPTTRRK